MNTRFFSARSVMGRLRDIALTCAVTVGVVATATAAIPNPTSVDLIPAVDAPGTPTHNYPFLATNLFPANSGYIEQEFLVGGRATRYSVANNVATPGDSNIPYKVRMVVRRPVDPAKFNGYVLVDWFNVTGSYELDIQWYRTSDYLIRKGYAYVGVGVQRVGIHANNTGLRAWSPTRYGSLDVTNGGAITDDSLRFDIYSQMGQAIRNPNGNPGGFDPLGGLQPRTLIATGDSQSASNLVNYLNTVHRNDPIYPGAVLSGPLGIASLPGGPTKVLKVPSEWDTINGEYRIRQADTDTLVSWEVAGMSHSPYHTFTANAEVRYRDVGVTGTLPGTANCIDPTRARVQSNFVFNAAYEAMVKWLSTGVRPASMTSPLNLADPLPTAGDRLARDQFGNSTGGGVRYPAVTVPIATNTGWNAGGKAPTSNGTCQQAGTHIAFTDARLRSLYTSHADYVNKVTAAAAMNVQQGFLLAEDAALIVAEAEKSDVLATPRADGSVRIVEFFHPAARRYVWVSDVAERNALDFEGAGGGGWFRTGETFFAWPANAASTPVATNPVCRLNGKPGVGLASHLFSPDPAFCAQLVAGGEWVSEGTAFRAPINCTSTMDPVTRLWHKAAPGDPARHRFTVRNDVTSKAVAEGFVLEGQVFCGMR
jgi:hypothetical protein